MRLVRLVKRDENKRPTCPSTWWALRINLGRKSRNCGPMGFVLNPGLLWQHFINSSTKVDHLEYELGSPCLSCEGEHLLLRVWKSEIAEYQCLQAKGTLTAKMRRTVIAVYKQIFGIHTTIQILLTLATNHFAVVDHAFYNHCIDMT